MIKEKSSIISLRKFAKEINKAPSTVQDWLAAGLIDGAELIEVGSIKVWQIPVDAIKSFVPPKRGRPKKDKQSSTIKKKKS